MQQQILLSLTFVFGVLRLISFTKLFNISLSDIFHSIFPETKTAFNGIGTLIGLWFFYFSLCYQSWYWLFKK